MTVTKGCKTEDDNSTTTTKAEGKVPFVCRNIVRKKKNPQQKMERYFPVTKPKAEKVEKNFQGFPVAQCRYEEEIDKLVFCPPGYPGRNNDKEREPQLCQECLLRPCMVKAKWNDIMGFCEDIMVFENDDSDGMYFKMINHAESIQVDLFGPRYARNNPLPNCVHQIVGNYLDVKSGMEQEGGDPDGELVSGAVDGTDFLTQSWQQS